MALARALAPEPRLLMLDEPMGSLDRALRERLPAELRAIFARLGLTVLYVTHDQEEAFGVADRMVILRDGRVEADGTPEALWSAPADGVRGRVPGVPQRRRRRGERRRRADAVGSGAATRVSRTAR